MIKIGIQVHPQRPNTGKKFIICFQSKLLLYLTLVCQVKICPFLPSTRLASTQFSVLCPLGSPVPNDLKSPIKSSKQKKKLGSWESHRKRFLESNASSIPGTYFRLGYFKDPRIKEAFDSRNLLLSTALDPKIV